MCGYSLPASETSSTIGRSPNPARGAGASASSAVGVAAAARAAALRAFLLALDGLWGFGFALTESLLSFPWRCPSDAPAWSATTAAPRFRLRFFGELFWDEAWLSTLLRDANLLWPCDEEVWLRERVEKEAVRSFDSGERGRLMSTNSSSEKMAGVSAPRCDRKSAEERSEKESRISSSSEEPSSETVP